MAIVYYPNRTFKKQVPAIDRVLAKREPQLLTGVGEANTNSVSVSLSTTTNWQINSILLDFSSNTSKDFSAYVKSGRKVITNLNDYLWVQMSNSFPQKITLNPAFYDGDELATELQTQLNANAEFITLGVTFTVTYNATTGIFTVTPSSGTIKYLNVNTTTFMTERDSICGHLFGFTTTGATFGATIVSDIAVPGLNGQYYIINETASDETGIYHDDIHILNMDQELDVVAAANGSGYNVTYAIGYENIV